MLAPDASARAMGVMPVVKERIESTLLRASKKLRIGRDWALPDFPDTILAYISGCSNMSVLERENR